MSASAHSAAIWRRYCLPGEMGRGWRLLEWQVRLAKSNLYTDFLL